MLPHENMYLTDEISRLKRKRMNIIEKYVPNKLQKFRFFFNKQSYKYILSYIQFILQSLQMFYVISTSR